jgi:hypothetical protein
MCIGDVGDPIREAMRRFTNSMEDGIRDSKAD